MFRGRFLALARRALQGAELPEIPWGECWVVHAKPCVQGADKVLDYLGRYVHRRPGSIASAPSACCTRGGAKR